MGMTKVSYLVESVQELNGDFVNINCGGDGGIKEMGVCFIGFSLYSTTI